MPTLSAIVPAFNRAELLPLTLRSLLRQTRPPDEIIVVDDGSTDGTAAVAAALGAPVRVVAQPNAGPAAARNRGLRESAGDLLLFFDSDDLLAPGSLAALEATLESTSADIAYSPWIKGRIEPGRFFPANHVLQQRGLPRDPSLVRALLSHWSIIAHAALYRRSLVVAAGGFPEAFFGVEDQAFFLHCLLHGARVRHAPGSLVLYRIGHPGNLTGSGMEGPRRMMEWARFLLHAREACLRAGAPDPLTFLGYKLRLWQSSLDLIGLPDAGEVRAALQALLPLAPSHPGFRLLRRCHQIAGGLQLRLTGGRAHASFRSGPLRPQQLLALQSMGLAAAL